MNGEKTIKKIDFGYGLFGWAEQLSTGEWVKPSDAPPNYTHWNDLKTAVKILDLLTAQEGLTTKEALEIIATVTNRIQSSQTAISQRVPLRSIFDNEFHIETSHRCIH